MIDSQVLTHIEAWVVIALPGLGWLLRRHFKKLRDENTEQHAEGRALLNLVAEKIDAVSSGVAAVDGKVDKLQAWQASHELLHRRTQGSHVRAGQSDLLGDGTMAERI